MRVGPLLNAGSRGASGNTQSHKSEMFYYNALSYMAIYLQMLPQSSSPSASYMHPIKLIVLATLINPVVNHPLKVEVAILS